MDLSPFLPLVWTGLSVRAADHGKSNDRNDIIKAKSRAPVLPLQRITSAGLITERGRTERKAGCSNGRFTVTELHGVCVGRTLNSVEPVLLVVNVRDESVAEEDRSLSSGMRRTLRPIGASIRGLCRRHGE